MQRRTNRNRHIPAFSHRPHANQVSYQCYADLRIHARLLLNRNRMIVAACSDFHRNSDPAHSLAPPEHPPTSRRCKHPPLADHHLPRKGQAVLSADDTTTDQTDDRTAVQELPAKHLLTMPIRHCVRLRLDDPGGEL